ncbi:hypothetical protein HPB48_006067 [Haemaphysalis longicornis]|uniref:Carboxylesterase type B domain-containing protein n=1 Tax=Haemaphysalis longicornis TaxID=44386 RepID=A0A9J6FNY4_HAELO|nr:hypothetical protein HPB48_006067 [Haemaphysalis longicornis]
MDDKHKKAAVSPSTSSVAGKKRNKKRSKMPSKDPCIDAGKKEGQAGAKVKSPNKKAAVSPSKYGGTSPPVAVAGSEKSRKKPSKNQKDAGETAAKAVSALELSGPAGPKTSTPDAGAVVSSSKTDVTSAQSPEVAEEKPRAKPSKHIPTTSDDTTKGSRRTEKDTVELPGESEDAQEQSSDGPCVQPAPTSAVPVTAQIDAKGWRQPRRSACLPGEVLHHPSSFVTFCRQPSKNQDRIRSKLICSNGRSFASVFLGPRNILQSDTCKTAFCDTGVHHIGRVRRQKVSVDGVDVYRWLGIPYAESTAGRYRFRKPRQRIEKQRTMAQDPRPPCPQLVNHTVVGSEDCLHMNVWAPKGKSGSGLNRTLVLASVSYWFQRGSNNDPDWAELAAKGNSTLSYRLLMAVHCRQMSRYSLQQISG